MSAADTSHLLSAAQDQVCLGLCGKQLRNTKPTKSSIIFFNVFLQEPSSTMYRICLFFEYWNCSACKIWDNYLFIWKFWINYLRIVLFLCGVWARTRDLCGIVAMGWAVLREIWKLWGFVLRRNKPMGSSEQWSGRLNIVIIRAGDPLVLTCMVELVV